MSFTPKIPKLPRTDNGEVTSFRHEVNPAIALNTLTNIYRKVQQYQIQLRELTQKIHKVYAEGPIVSGWLASEASLNAAVKYSDHADNSANHPSHSKPGHEHKPAEAPTKQFHQNLESPDVALFRHGDTNDLMNYLSALESAVLENGKSDIKNSATSHLSAVSTIAPDLDNQESQTHSSVDNNGKSSHYYLCRLTSCGQIQTEPCPPEQVPVLSMAIARYRRLAQLTKQKQAIETKLQAIVDILGDIETVIAD